MHTTNHLWLLVLSYNFFLKYRFKALVIIHQDLFMKTTL